MFFHWSFESQNFKRTCRKPLPHPRELRAHKLKSLPTVMIIFCGFQDFRIYLGSIFFLSFLSASSLTSQQFLMKIGWKLFFFKCRLIIYRWKEKNELINFYKGNPCLKSTEKCYSLKQQGQSKIRGVQWQSFDPTI